MDPKRLGSDSFPVKRSEKLPNIGPGHIHYGDEERFATNKSAGANLPFRQTIKETEE